MKKSFLPSLKIKRQHPEIEIPKYQTSGAAGMDLRAFLAEDLLMKPNTVYAVPTGLFIEIPSKYEGQIRSRSGLSLRGIVVANSPGTIDSDYRGEIKILLKNSTDTEFVLTNGQRIAQLVIAPALQMQIEEVEFLSETERGEGGLGSTGTK